MDKWHYRYVLSKSNPADFSSRPVAAAKLSYSHEWLCGSPLLLQSKSAWPEPPVLLPELPCEILSCKTEPVQSKFTAEVAVNDPIDVLINRCSSLIKLKRPAAWSLRLKDKLHCRKPKGFRLPLTLIRSP